MFERFVVEQRLAGNLSILVEEIHFGLCITFCQDSYVDTVFSCSALEQITVRSNPFVAPLVNQDILRIDLVGE